MQFKVKAAGVTHRVSVPVAPPQGGGGGLAVCTAGACASGSGQSAFGLDERSVLAVHLVVQSAGVAQVVAGTIPSPQGGGGGTAVYTFTAL